MKLKEKDEFFAMMQQIAIKVAKEQRIYWDIKPARKVFEHTLKNNCLIFKS